ncbi:MAG: diguanylate cyclase [Pseudomonadota bacterium]
MTVSRTLPAVAVLSAVAVLVLMIAVTDHPAWLDLLMIIVIAGLACAMFVAWRQSTALHTAIHALPDKIQRATEGVSDVAHAAPSDLKETTDRLMQLANTIREERLARQVAEQAALTDPLTGLTNRRGLFAWVAGQGKHTAERLKGRIGVMHVDLDHFKAVNDTLGHAAGDAVLKEASRRMSSVIRDTDLLARLGGDEFVAVLPGMTDPAVLINIAERLHALLAEPFEVEGQVCPLSASIGLLLAGRDSEMPEPARMLVNADTALCHAKAAGRGRHVLFTPSMAVDLVQQREMAEAIHAGLQSKAFFAAFEPVLDMETDEVVGVEILSKWRHAHQGVLTVDAFSQAADLHNLSEDLVMQVLEDALSHAAKWRADGLNFPPLLLRLGTVALLSTAMIDKVTWAIDRTALPPDALSIVADEAALFDRNAALALANLKRFRAHGLQVVIGDFGMHGGGLAHAVGLDCPMVLTECALDTAEPEGRGARLLIGLTALRQALGLETVVHGVETDWQVQTLARLGVRQMSGSAIAPELEGSQVADLLRNRAAITKNTAAAGNA